MTVFSWRGSGRSRVLHYDALSGWISIQRYWEGKEGGREREREREGGRLLPHVNDLSTLHKRYRICIVRCKVRNIFVFVFAA